MKVCSGAAYSVSRGTITCPIYYTAPCMCCRERKGVREMKSKRGEREMSGGVRRKAVGGYLNGRENEVLYGLYREGW